MKELLEYIAKSMVDNPDEVEVTEVEEENGTKLELRVAPSDMGKIIGRQGRTSKEIRAIVKAAAGSKRVVVDIIDKE